MTTYTQFANYPQLFYLLTGVPSLVFAGDHAVYAMRLLALIVNALLVALGIFLLVRFHPARSTLFGVVIALSPMVLFLSSVLNSSGIEICSAFATWCGGSCIVARKETPKTLIGWTALSAVILLWSRPLSPLYLAVTALALALAAGWRRSRAIAGQPEMRILYLAVGGGLLVYLIALAAGGPPAWFGQPVQNPKSFGSELNWSLSLTWPRLRETIGKFGWLDTPAPHWTVVIWVGAFCTVTAIALLRSSRCRRAIPFLAAVVVVLPLLFEAPHINAHGLSWQGRYCLPILVGIPLLASGALPRFIGRSRLTLPVFAVAGAALTFAQIDAFLQALRRYVSGLQGGTPTLPHWSPPGGRALSIVLFIVGETFFTAYVVWKATPSRARTAERTSLERRGAVGPSPKTGVLPR